MFNDSEVRLINYCIPHPDLKEGLWRLFVNKDKVMPLSEYESLMKAFNRCGHYSNENKVYLRKKFFKDFVKVNRIHDREYVNMFYFYLNPSFVINKKVNLFFLKF